MLTLAGGAIQDVIFRIALSWFGIYWALVLKKGKPKSSRLVVWIYFLVVDI